MSKIQKKRKHKRVKRFKLTVYVKEELVQKIDDRVHLLGYRSRSELVEKWIDAQFLLKD